ncbi:MAG: YicC family protein [Deltaproteobacteria bacterium]|jgi:uncharacterized protein (TIGR00255 family)|nr:YicC family protein [Deltaproteobacteria bacterium]
MTKSMTGYGQATGTFQSSSLSVELKTLNNRFREIYCRLPFQLTSLEEALKKILAEKIARGRVEITLQLSTPPDELQGFAFNPSKAEAALRLLEKLREETGVTDPISLNHLLALNALDQNPTNAQGPNAASLAPLAQSLTQEALADLVAFREREGAAMERDLLTRLEILERILSRIKSLIAPTNAAIFEKLKNRIEELIQKAVSPERLAVEAAILADRMDITEEVVRFASHLANFRLALTEPLPIGRRLEFLLQELNREANTMGSKSQSTPLTDEILAIKFELEKARELAQNIE